MCILHRLCDLCRWFEEKNVNTIKAIFSEYSTYSSGFCYWFGPEQVYRGHILTQVNGTVVTYLQR